MFTHKFKVKSAVNKTDHDFCYGKKELSGKYFLGSEIR